MSKDVPMVCPNKKYIPNSDMSIWDKTSPSHKKLSQLPYYFPKNFEICKNAPRTYDNDSLE